MTSNRRAAGIVGVLFIVATAASLMSAPFLGPVNSSDYLVSVSANRGQVATAVLLSFIAAASSAGIAISLYPTLREHHESLALGAVGFRLIEAVFLIGSAMCLLVLITLSQEFVKAGAPASSYFQTMGVLVQAGFSWTGNVGSLLAFCLGALMYYYIFYRTGLVPRWLSAWGLVGATMCMAAGLLVMFGLIGPMSTTQVVLALPIAVQEMALAVWLMAKGFRSPAIASGRSI